jgi:hypothetical protein
MRRLFPLFLALLLLSVAAIRAAEPTRDDADLLAIFTDNPDQISGGVLSHCPIPAVYSDFQTAVTERFGRDTLTKFAADLRADLPPARDADEKNPENKALAALIQQDKARAVGLIARALNRFPDRSKWSILDACGALDSAELDKPLERIALTDTNATHRAFAFKAIARRKQANAEALLQEGLFDTELSVRLLCMELLGSTGNNVSCVTAAMPCRPRNPFHFYFLESALKRVMPQIDAQTFFKQPFSIRIGACAGAAPEETKNFLALAEKRATQPYAAMVLYLCGDAQSAEKALQTLTALLREFGRKTYDHQSPEFQIQSDIVDVLQQSRREQFAQLAKLFKTTLREFSQEREVLLTVLAYGLSVSEMPEIAEDLAGVRELQTKNKDLLIGAALALAQLKSPLAIPSLIQIMSLHSNAYTLVAMRALEKITGTETPGVPKAGTEADSTQKPIDPASVYRFWREWMQKQDHDLQFDPETKVIK